MPSRRRSCACITPRAGRSARSPGSCTSTTAPCAACCGKAASRRCASAPEPRSSMPMCRSSRRPSRAIRRCARAGCTGWCASAATSATPITSGTWSPDGDRGRRPKRICACAPCRRNKRRSTGRTSASSTIGRAQRPLMAFVMVLSYSRHLFVRFYLNAGTAQLPRRPRAGLRLLYGRAPSLSLR